MISATDLKKGKVIEVNGAAHIVVTVAAKSPSARGGTTLYKIRTRNLVTGQKADHSFKGDDMLKEADFEKREVEFSYIDGENYVFVDLETFEQHELNKDFIADDIKYLKEGMECTALLVDGALKALTLPPIVTLKVIECDPSMKTASATARTKNATVETGLTLQVPEYLENDELIRINTLTGEFQSREKK